ncbi:group 2 family glycosyl transferase [Corallococcus macrosporus]|uniref:Group 2 family glycosyl transferase n=1 Tax=Myxococcus fulvus (strain ATCC BAA-855 / HW-1) TaxID=483219 RepID=F8CJB2_MYXFH|nr:group 2 family glycosyl transferase [Corallococcus macrosporus]
MPFFSVVIPTYNRARLLEVALDSVFAQEERDFEVLVVDDGSTDDTLELLARYGGRVRVLGQPNAGPGAARNLGIQEARGTYVAFLDSDDVWFPWTLATYRRVLEAEGGTSLVLGTSTLFSRVESLAGVAREPLQVLRFTDYLASAGDRTPRTACVLAVRTEALRRVGGFTPLRISGEDYDLLYRLGTEPGFAWVRAPVVVGYRQHEGSTSTSLESGYRGTRYLLEQERLGRYPGGAARRRERPLLLQQVPRAPVAGLQGRGRGALMLPVAHHHGRAHPGEARLRAQPVQQVVVLAADAQRGEAAHAPQRLRAHRQHARGARRPVPGADAALQPAPCVALAFVPAPRGPGVGFVPARPAAPPGGAALALHAGLPAVGGGHHRAPARDGPLTQRPPPPINPPSRPPRPPPPPPGVSPPPPAPASNGTAERMRPMSAGSRRDLRKFSSRGATRDALLASMLKRPSRAATAATSPACPAAPPSALSMPPEPPSWPDMRPPSAPISPPPASGAVWGADVALGACRQVSSSGTAWPIWLAASGPSFSCTVPCTIFSSEPASPCACVPFTPSC